MIKKILTIVLVFGLGAFSMAAVYPRPRFEMIHKETYQDPDGSEDSLIFYVIHDRETGQETVCIRPIFDARSPSCYLTGRSWGAIK